MQGMILQTAPENKDIKFSNKKGADTKSEKTGDIFEDLIAKLVLKEGKNENADFLLGKLLNISSNFANKGKIISGNTIKNSPVQKVCCPNHFFMSQAHGSFSFWNL